MIKSLLVIVCLCGTLAGSRAAGIEMPAAFVLPDGDTVSVIIAETPVPDLAVVSPEEFLNESESLTRKPENKRLIASILAVALGPFGAHRIYLGTNHLVPVVYVLTLGGGLGILPAIDLAVMLFSKDIKPYENNRKIFMWAN